eukprot:jgi/Hompol1/6383/HPOL_000767-RA
MFKDYDPTQTYTIKTTITNISGRINSFKLVPVPIEISSLFDIQFPPPGKISAGTCCEIDIVFRPPPGFDRDIPPTRVQFQAEMGPPFTITVGCLTRKCLPVIASVGGSDTAKRVQFHEKIVMTDDGSTKRVSDLDVNRLVGNVSGSKRIQPVAVMDPVDGVLKIDMGMCVVGASRSVEVDLANLGATSVPFEVMPEGLYHQWLTHFGEAMTDATGVSTKTRNAGGQESVAGARSSTRSSRSSRSKKTADGAFHVRSTGNLLKGYDSQLIHIDFKPPYVNPPRSVAVTTASGATVTAPAQTESLVKSRFVIRFGDEQIKPILIECRAISTSAPLFIDRDVIDFRVCLLDHSYQDHLIVRNHHNIALKFWIDLEG